MSFLAFQRYIRLSSIDAPTVEGPWGEEQQSDYEAGTVRLDGQLWRIRTARVTPTKPGAFVAVWERGERGETRPFAADDSLHGLMVFVADQAQFGVFRFTAAELERLGVSRSVRQAGKRGFRLYPEWSSGLNPQALRTQRAQASSFTVLE